MDIFEYSEVCWPTRALQQEEEEQAVSTAAEHLRPPTIEWKGQAAQRPELLVVAMSAASCALLEGAVGGGEPAGLVHSGGGSSGGGDGCNSNSRDHEGVPRLTPSVPPARLFKGGEGVMVCCCSKPVPPEVAPAWARGVVQQLQPRRLLLVGSMQAEQYRGEADPSQAFLHFLLRTTAAREADGQGGGKRLPAPYLPSGSVVAGLPAALLTAAELAGLPADLVVVVDMVPALVPATLQQLADMLAAALGSAGGRAAAPVAARVVEAGVVEAARGALQQTACRPSSVYS